MPDTCALLVIIKRESEQDYMNLFADAGISAVYSIPGVGTASNSILDLLGLDSTEKTVLLTVLPRSKALKLKGEFISRMGINMPGSGIAMQIPVNSFAGARSVAFLLGREIEKNEEAQKMEAEKSYPYDLIIAICQRGMSDVVMEAARNAGAKGGTIVHAKGTASLDTARFFGISIANEKELMLIATRHENHSVIMHAIAETKNSDGTPCAVQFTVPVEDISGLRSVMEQAEP